MNEALRPLYKLNECSGTMACASRRDRVSLSNEEHRLVMKAIVLSGRCITGHVNGLVEKKKVRSQQVYLDNLNIVRVNTGGATPFLYQKVRCGLT